MSSIIELKVLGGIELSGPDGQALYTVLAQPKRLALLTYLALSPRGFIRRDTIVGVFWPKLDDEHARNALSQSLRFLRRHLGEMVILRRGEEEVALNHEAIGCDAVELEQACSRNEHERAVELYRGELLAGFHVSDAWEFDRWLEDRRAHLARCYSRSLDAAAEEYSRTNRTAEAVELRRRRAAAEPHNSAVALKLMRALAAVGDRAGAIEHASEHQKRLAADLRTQPDPAIVALAERLRAAPEGLVDLARADAVPPLTAQATPVERPSGRLRARTTVMAALVVAGLLLAASAARTRPAQSKRVVVAIFENQTGDSSLARLGVIAADWITQGLQRTGLVDVSPSGSMLALASEGSHDRPAHGTAALRDLARAAGAGYVVNGVMSMEGRRLRFQPQIIEASTMRLVGAPSAVLVERDDPTRGIEELRQHVMGSLASVLDPRVASWAATASNPPSLAAFAEFQNGLDELVRHHDARESVAHFQRAADADSTYLVPRLWMILGMMRVAAFTSARVDSEIATVARSRTRLARTDALMLQRIEALRRNDREAASRAALQLVALSPASYFVTMMAEDAAAANRAREAVEILSRLDPEWPWVRDWQDYWSLLAFQLHALGDFSRELQVAQRARSTRPASRRFLWLECQALVALGRVDEVQKLVGNVDTLPLREPANYGGDFSPDGLLRNLGLELRAHGYEEAGRAMLRRADAWYVARATIRKPDWAQAHQHMLILEELERWEDASSEARSVLEGSPSAARPRTAIARSAVALGDTARAREQLARLIQSDSVRNFPVHLFEAAKVATALGERERAMELLREAYAKGHPHSFWDHLAIEFEPLRTLPAYQALMQPKT